ncbi:MAG: imidazole glycerol phosphate synthase subunit HisH [Desulfovibrionaceae bacterium]|nr:imidazole glycerol phosphate synthase subunit HisH [Desulfovibrionaceae bacterium]
MLAILDYKAGNQTSVRRALEYLGIPCTITDDKAVLAAAQGIVFPGVGAAGQAMQLLRSSGLDASLRQAVAVGQPLLGICLGCQILLDSSEEDGFVPTLGIVPGVCRRFAQGLCQEDGSPAPIPHMGWNGVQQKKPSRLLANVPAQAEFYFVHSYYVEPAPELVIGTTLYGKEFCSLYGRDGLWAAQFHLEKSGQAGLTVLRNFYEYCQEVAPC